MNARELINRLSELDPNTTIRYRYWDDYSQEGDVVEVVDCVSARGWINESDSTGWIFEVLNEEHLDPKPWVTPDGYRYAKFNEGEAMFGAIMFSPRPEYEQDKDRYGDVG